MNPSSVLRAVIADDEAGARQHLRALLEVCHVHVTGECATGGDLLAVVERARPDFVCLDIRMPEMDGLEVARRLGSHPAPGSHPAVVFTTGYADYAAWAFELDAIDYLLKPLSLARVEETIRRVRVRLRHAGVAAAPVPRLFIPAADHSLALAPEAIRFVEARGGASLIHADGATYRLRTPLVALERALASSGFLRTHRAYLVNLWRVRALVPWSRHTYSLLLDGGEETHVPVAKSRLAAFRGSVIWIPHAGGHRGGPRTAGESGDRGRREPGPGPRDRGGPGG